MYHTYVRIPIINISLAVCVSSLCGTCTSMPPPHSRHLRVFTHARIHAPSHVYLPPSYPFPSHLIPSHFYPILSHPISSHFISFHPFPSRPIPFRLISFHPIQSPPIPSRPIQSDDSHEKKKGTPHEAHAGAHVGPEAVGDGRWRGVGDQHALDQASARASGTAVVQYRFVCFFMIVVLYIPYSCTAV